MHYVYILECRDGTFYTGITWNLKKRFIEHSFGKGALYTKSRLPIKLVYFESFRNKPQSAMREKIIKDMSQVKKKGLIKKFTSSVSEKRR